MSNGFFCTLFQPRHVVRKIPWPCGLFASTMGGLQPLSKAAGLPNPKESDLDKHRTVSLRTTPAFSSTVEHPQRIQRFLDGLSAPVVNAPSLYSWQAWRQMVARWVHDEEPAVRQGRAAATWHGPILTWLADVAVLDTQAPFTPQAQVERLRLAHELLTLQDPRREALAQGTEGSIVEHLWWVADHVDGWIQRDRGSVHTLKRLQSVSALLRRFAGPCLDVWLGTDVALREPSLIDAAERALAIARTPWSTVAPNVARSSGLPSAVVARSTSFSAGSMGMGRGPTADPCHLQALFARCWDAMGTNLQQLDEAMRQGLEVDGAPLSVVLPLAVEAGGLQDPQGCEDAQAAIERERATVIDASRRAEEALGVAMGRGGEAPTAWERRGRRPR